MSNAKLNLPEEPIARGELAISYLLRGGVVTSIAVIVVGVVLMFVHHPSYFYSSRDYKALATRGASFPHTLGQVASGLRDGRGEAVVCTGLLLLIATPILRVGVSIVVFATQRDWVFVLITGFVLAVLLLSFLLGKAE
jgi:uncharacterized membrane protein